MNQKDIITQAIKQEGPPPKWLERAIAELGVTEIPGKRNNPRIESYHRSTSLGKQPDETPWCSSFVNWCFESVGMKGTNSASAISWEDWGRSLEMGQIGAVTTIWRSGGSGRHVGFYLMEPLWMDPDDPSYFFWMLGGNQSNKVCITTYPFDLIMDIRWP